MAIASNALREGSLFSFEGSTYQVLNYQHIKKGRGQAVIKVKVRNIETGANTELSFTNEERLDEVDAEKRSAQYLYNEGDEYFFMDNESFEQYQFKKDFIGEAPLFLIEGMKVIVLFVEGAPQSIELPKSVELKIIDTEPAVPGNTATGASKTAELETGLEVLVPLFLKIGDKVKINTETKKYTARVQ